MKRVLRTFYVKLQKFNSKDLKVIIVWILVVFTLMNFTKVSVGVSPPSCSTNSCFTTDTVKFTDSASVIQFIFKVIDKFMVTESAILKALGITTVTTYITSVITQISTNCAGSSCYANPNATGTEAIFEFVVFPAMFIFGTIMGFIYMNIKAFGVTVLLMSFLTLGLAYIGIIPSYFTLLTIIMVGAALTKLLTGMFSGGTSV